MFTSSTKRENRKFHALGVQRRQRNIQKSLMHGQNCCFANLNLLASFAVPVAVVFGVAYNKLPIKVARLDFFRAIPPKFEP